MAKIYRTPATVMDQDLVVGPFFVGGCTDAIFDIDIANVDAVGALKVQCCNQQSGTYKDVPFTPKDGTEVTTQAVLSGVAVAEVFRCTHLGLWVQLLYDRTSGSNAGNLLSTNALLR